MQLDEAKDAQKRQQSETEQKLATLRVQAAQPTVAAALPPAEEQSQSPRDAGAAGAQAARAAPVDTGLANARKDGRPKSASETKICIGLHTNHGVSDRA